MQEGLLICQNSRRAAVRDADLKRLQTPIRAASALRLSPVLTVNAADYVEQRQFDRFRVCSALRFVGPYGQRSEQRRAGSRQIKDVILF